MADNPYAAFASPVADDNPYAALASQVPAPDDQGNVASFLRGMNKAIPFAQYAVAAADTITPEALGGTKGWNFNQNLANERQWQQESQQQHPIASNLGQGTGSVIASYPFTAAAAPAALAERVGQAIVQGAGISGLQAVSDTDKSNLSQAIYDTAKASNTGAAVGGGASLAAVLAGRALSPFQKAPTTIGNEFTSSVMNQGNIPGNSVRPETLGAAKGTIVDDLNTVAGRNTLIPDAQLHQDIAAASGGPNKLISPTETARNAANDLLAEVPLSGTMSGADYAARRSELSNKAYNLRMTDPVNASVYRGLRDALDSGMDRSIAANNPGDVGVLPGIRQSYGNLLDVAKAASKIKGNDLQQGTLPPSRLAAVLSAGNKGPAYGMGEGSPLVAMTQAAMENEAPKAVPSDLSSVLGHYATHAAIRGGLGAYGGYETGGGLPAILGGAAAGAILPKVLNSSIVNNQLAPRFGEAINANVTPRMLSLVRALAAKQISEQGQR